MEKNINIGVLVCTDTVLNVAIKIETSRWLNNNQAVNLFYRYIHRFVLPHVFFFFLIYFLLSFLKVSSHSEPSSQSLSLQQPAQPPPPPPPPPQPQYGLPVPESRDKQLCFSDFEDLSASFRSLYKCIFEQPFSQPGGCQPSPWISVTAQASTSNVWKSASVNRKTIVNLLSGVMLIVNWHV